MTYVCICKYMLKTPLEFMLYIKTMRKFTAYLRHDLCFIFHTVLFIS